MTGFNMDDYVPVAERIDALKAAFPDACLQSEIVELSDSRVTVKAYAYRSPDDERPGIGHSSVEIPGRTPYTKGSEIENAETSAWGRAIAALGFEVKRGIGSAEEVRNKQGAGGDSRGSSTPSRPASPRDELLAVAKAHGIGAAKLEELASEVGVPSGQKATDEQVRAIIARIEQPEAARAHAPGGAGEVGSSVPASPDSDAAEVDPKGVPAHGEADAATSAPGGFPPATAAPAAPTDDEILAVTGGEFVPPKPGTDEYRALPNGTERAKARKYWEEHEPKAEQESLAEALGGVTSD